MNTDPKHWLKANLVAPVEGLHPLTGARQAVGIEGEVVVEEQRLGHRATRRGEAHLNKRSA